MLLQFKIIALSGYDVNSLKIIYALQYLKLGFHVTHHALYYTILPFLTVSVANLAALGCVRFCFSTFLTRKIWLF